MRRPRRLGLGLPRPWCTRAGVAVIVAEGKVDLPDGEHRGIHGAQRVFPAPFRVQPAIARPARPRRDSARRPGGSSRRRSPTGRPKGWIRLPALVRRRKFPIWLGPGTSTKTSSCRALGLALYKAVRLRQALRQPLDRQIRASGARIGRWLPAWQQCQQQWTTGDCSAQEGGQRWADDDRSDPAAASWSRPRRSVADCVADPRPIRPMGRPVSSSMGEAAITARDPVITRMLCKRVPRIAGSAAGRGSRTRHLRISRVLLVAGRRAMIVLLGARRRARGRRRGQPPTRLLHRRRPTSPIAIPTLCRG